MAASQHITYPRQNLQGSVFLLLVNSLRKLKVRFFFIGFQYE